MVNDTFVFMPYLCNSSLSIGWQMNLRWAEYATPHTGWTDSLLPDGYSDFARLHELCWLLTFTPVRAHIFYIPNDTKWKVPFEIWHTQLNLPINPIPFKPSKKTLQQNLLFKITLCLTSKKIEPQSHYIMTLVSLLLLIRISRNWYVLKSDHVVLSNSK